MVAGRRPLEMASLLAIVANTAYVDLSLQAVLRRCIKYSTKNHSEARGFDVASGCLDA